MPKKAAAQKTEEKVMDAIKEAAAEAPKVEAATEAPKPGFFKRNMKKVVGGGVAVVVIVAGIAWMLMTGSEPGQSETSTGDEV